MRDHHRNVFTSHVDDGYLAAIPDLEACCAFASTPQEARAEALRAKQG